MSLQTEDFECGEDLNKRFIVFEGSAPEDVSHARQLWSSMYLQPPMESQLVSADIRQRLPVSRPQRSGVAAVPGPRLGPPEPPSVFELRQRQEERQRCEATAERRREIVAQLRMRRQQRIEKEMLSAAFKPKLKIYGKLKPQEAAD
ncbi:cilia- and flagella-associated protein HOATZ [Xenentodon cancila]